MPLILLLLVAFQAAGEVLPVRTYTASDGLLRDRAFCLRKDSRGFLWFCTADGISRFDGYSFRNYTTDDGLPDRVVYDLIETRDGKIWIATAGGLAIFNPRGERAAPGISVPLFSVVLPGDSDQSRQINVLFEDSRGDLLVGTDDGLFRVGGENGSPVALKIGLPRPRVNQFHSVSAIIELADGRILVGMDYQQGLNIVDRDGSVRNLRAERSPGKSESVKSLLQSADGTIWAGLSVDGGLCRVDLGNDGGPSLTGCLTRADGMPSNWVAELYESSDGRIWAATTDGVAVVDLTPKKPSIRTLRAAEGFCDGGSDGILEDVSGNIWVATACGVKRLMRDGFVRFTTADGLGSARVNGFLAGPEAVPVIVTLSRAEGNGSSARQLNFFRDGRFRVVTPRLPDGSGTGWGHGQIVAFDADGSLWLGGALRGAYRFGSLGSQNPRTFGIPDQEVFRIFSDSRGAVWISTMYEGHLLRFDPSSGELTDFPEIGAGGVRRQANSFVETADGTIFAGFEYTDQIARFRSGKWEFVSVGADRPIGNVNSVFFDADGHLWIATSQAGVARIKDPFADGMLSGDWFNRQNGLSTDGTTALTQDRLGRIYVAHGRGVDRIDPASGRIRRFSSLDGLPGGLNDNVFRDADGNIWYGGTNGLARLTPVADRPRRSPNVLVTGLRTGGVRRPISELGETEVPEIALGSSQNQIGIDFVGLGAELGEDLRYEYRVGGGDWIGTTQRSVELANLAPGVYRFEVRAVSFDGLQSERPASVAFAVPAPFWRRPWFVAFSFALFAFASYGLYRNRVRQAIEIERVRTRIATDLHDDIGANLTKISILSEVARQRTTDDTTNAATLESIAEISRDSVASMSDIVWAINPKKDTFGDLLRRMRSFAEETLQARGIDLEFESSEGRSDVPLGADVRRQFYLVFKEAINNAVRHSGATRVDVRVAFAGRDLKLSVVDNGSGFDPGADFEGNGIGNMRRRAAQIGADLRIRSDKSRGTRVDLSLGIGARR